MLLFVICILQEKTIWTSPLRREIQLALPLLLTPFFHFNTEQRLDNALDELIVTVMEIKMSSSLGVGLEFLSFNFFLYTEFKYITA